MSHIPKPFSRPSATISSSPVKRSWRYVSTGTLESGDIVEDKGEVVSVHHGVNVEVLFLSGARLNSRQAPAVRAFVRDV